MKNLKRIALALLLGLSATQVSAQYGVGANLGYLYLMGDAKVSTMGINIQGHYAVSDKILATASIGYYFPKDVFSYDVSTSAMSIATVPSSIDVPVTEKVSFIPISVEAKYYLIGEVEGDFNLYGFAGAGILIAPVTATVGAYNSSLYYEPFVESTTYGNFTLNLGVGAEYNLGFGYLFADAKIALPAELNSGNSATQTTTSSSPKIPTSFVINAGVRIPFGN